MLMNNVEFWAMNNSIRRASQYFEVKRLFKMANRPNGGNILEIGGGEGQGAKNILRQFNPDHLISIDLDPKMIARAQKRVKDSRVEFYIQDAANLRNFKNNSFDLVIDMAILHHIPNWQDCLSEVYRVLKPNGQFLIQDASIESFSMTRFGRFMHKHLEHPYDVMYTKEQFEHELETIGFRNKDSKYFKPYLMWKIETK